MTPQRPISAALAILWMAAFLGLMSPPSQSFAQAGPGTVASEIENLSFRSPVQERRFFALIGNMRCTENPDQSLVESTSPQAREMRMLVYQMLQDDRVDFEIRNAVVDRYGDDALYQSAFPGHRLLLKAGPFLLLVVGLIAAFIVSMKKRRPAAPPVA